MASNNLKILSKWNHIYHQQITGYLKIPLIGFVILQVISHMVNTHIDYDEGYNLQVSLLLNLYNVYSTFDTIFDPYITTGPTVLIPSALFIYPKFPLLPRIVTVVYSFILLFLLYRKLQSDRQKIFFLTMLNFVPLFYFFSSHILGEIPSFTFFILSIIYFQKKRYIVSGIFLAFAFLTKSIIIIGIASIIYLILIDYFNNKNLGKCIHKALKFILGLSLPLLLWQGYILFSSNFEISTYISIINNSLLIQSQKSSMQFSLYPARFEMILYVFNIHAVIFLLISYVIAISILIHKKLKNNFFSSISIFFLVNTSYFILFGATNWYRHFFLSVLALFILISYLVGKVTVIHMRNMFILIFLLSHIIFNITSNQLKQIYVKKRIEQNLIFDFEHMLPIFYKDNMLVAQLDMARFIENYIEDYNLISGIDWWNAPEISYLTQRRINRDPKSTKVTYLITHLYGELLDTKKTNIIKNRTDIRILYKTDRYTLYNKVN
ncbi:MAG TPA: hypothetical protein PLS49_00445 [Candidatus Woesebacteria bacterium]|nr:hypothetical protein [Candidatus Woesebacteria bacterium]